MKKQWMNPTVDFERISDITNVFASPEMLNWATGYINIGTAYYDSDQYGNNTNLISTVSSNSLYCALYCFHGGKALCRQVSAAD